MRKKEIARLVLVILLASSFAVSLFVVSGCGTPTLTLATTATIGNSPVYKALIKDFESNNSVNVTTLKYVNSKEVLNAGAGGKADALLVSKNAALEDWMNKGYASSADDVFYSDFVVVGPDADPAQIRGLDCPGKSCKKIGTAGAAFFACGDGSDLDTKVTGYWVKAGIDPVGQPWYTKTGEAIAKTLAAADGEQAYTIVDNSTWLARQNNLSLKKLVEGCSMLMNQYSIVVVNPEKFKNGEINSKDARAFVVFALGEDAQNMIGKYKESDMVIYHPNATEEPGEKGSNM